MVSDLTASLQALYGNQREARRRASLYGRLTLVQVQREVEYNLMTRLNRLMSQYHSEITYGHTHTHTHLIAYAIMASIMAINAQLQYKLIFRTHRVNPC